MRFWNRLRAFRPSSSDGSLEGGVSGDATGVDELRERLGILTLGRTDVLMKHRI